MCTCGVGGGECMCCGGGGVCVCGVLLLLWRVCFDTLTFREAIFRDRHVYHPPPTPTPTPTHTHFPEHLARYPENAYTK